MSAYVVLVSALVVWGAVLIMAESSILRVSRVRAMALREDGRRNAATLERIQTDPARYLNSIYFAVLATQNASAILVAYIAEKWLGEGWVTAAAFVFTLLYFVFVEAMAKTFAVLHSDRVALALAPLTAGISRLLSFPTRLLIGLANVLLPGKGLKSGPFISQDDILSMATVGHAEGGIDQEEKELIHSIFEFGDTLVREIMIPRPDMIIVEAHKPLRRAMDLAIKHGMSRIPVFEKDQDNIVGIAYIKDLMRVLRKDADDASTVADVMRTATFIPESKPVAGLLKEFQSARVHMAIVVDEYGDVAGLVTLEDVLEEIVGEISDEYDPVQSNVLKIGDGVWRVRAKLAISDLNELVGTELSDDEEWTTVGGLVFAALGKVPEAGDEIDFEGIRFTAERVEGRRLSTVVVSKL